MQYFLPIYSNFRIMKDFMLTEEEKESLCHPDNDSSSMNPRKILPLVVYKLRYVFISKHDWREGGV